MAPRTPVVLTMEVLFLIRISSKSARLGGMLVADNILNIWIELINMKKDNVLEKFYLVHWFSKFDIFGRNSEAFEISGKMTKFSREALLLYELFERGPG